MYESLSSRHWQCATPKIKKRSKSPEEKKEAGLGGAVEVRCGGGGGGGAAC